MAKKITILVLVSLLELCLIASVVITLVENINHISLAQWLLGLPIFAFLIYLCVLLVLFINENYDDY